MGGARRAEYCRHPRGPGRVTGKAQSLGENQPRAAGRRDPACPLCRGRQDRSEEHTSELQSLMRISYAVFCLKKKNCYNQDYKSTFYKVAPQHYRDTSTTTHQQSKNTRIPQRTYYTRS